VKGSFDPSIIKIAAYVYVCIHTHNFASPENGGLTSTFAPFGGNYAAYGKKV